MQCGPSMSKTPPPHSLESAYHDYSQSHVLYTIFLKISKKGLSTCFRGLFTVHRFVSSRVTVVAPSKTGSAKHSSNKKRCGVASPGKVRPAHCLQWAVPPGGQGDAQGRRILAKDSQDLGSQCMR